ncbi:MAG: hypothetical protein JRI46_08960 [Deltaproteobacteria bacterium]|nr:hypothetical protein [Deltaproteobacteria bacterium]
MKIEEVYDEFTLVVLEMEKEVAVKGDVDFPGTAGRLQLVSERPGMIRVVARYHRLLAQMHSVLEGMGSVRVSDETGGRNKEKNDPANEEISKVPVEVSPIEETIKERMTMIEDVLEYASSHTGISVKLLAAVAWAESRMIPCAVNVKGVPCAHDHQCFVNDFL